MNRPPTDGAKASLWRKYLVRSGRLLTGLILLVGAFLVYLNQAGVPRFARVRIEEQLRARGVDLEVGRLRLQGLRTWVAENVRWRKAGDTVRPDLAIPEAELQLNLGALLRFKLEPETFRVRQGRLTFPFAYSNLPPAKLPIENIGLEVRFLTDTRWQLAHFAARCLNANLRISGVITNAAEFGKRKPPDPRAQAASGWPRWLHGLATELERVRLDPTSTLRLDIQGDARDQSTFRATVDLQAPTAAIASATVENIRLGVNVAPKLATAGSLNATFILETGRLKGKTGELERVLFSSEFGVASANWSRVDGRWRCELRAPKASWGGAENFSASGTVRPPIAGTGESILDLVLRGDGIRTPWGAVESATLTADLRYLADRIESLNGNWKFEARQLNSKWGASATAQLLGRLRRASVGAGQRESESLWGWREALDSLDLDWEGQVGRITSPNLEVERFDLAGDWRTPELALRKLHARIYDGQFDLAGGLNTSNRAVEAKLNFDFDVHRIAPLLTTNTQRWLQQFSWEKPPAVTAEASMILPAWTNREPRRFRDAAKAAALSGSFQAGPGAFRGVAVASAHSRFTLLDRVWRLPDLFVQRPEGQAELSGVEYMDTPEYSWTVRSQIDPKVLRPLLNPAQRRVLDYFEFTQPPFVQGEFRGQWRRPDLVGASAIVVVTNLTFRGEAFDEFRAAIHYTNRVVSFSDAEVRRGSQRATASRADFDSQAGVVYLTNGVSTMEPDLVARVISTPVRAAIAPYHFHEPPTVIVNGRLPTISGASADAEFGVAGKQFAYWRFKLPEVSANVRWHDDSVTISNLQAAFYGGRLKWDGKFDFTDKKPTRYEFRGQVAKSDLRSLISDLTLTNTPLEGTVDGNLVITSADTSDWQTWRGFGDAQLHDGFIWSVPVFGIFSPILNNIVPGIGPSRISAATATFAIDKGLIKTSDLEMRAPALRLQYVGSVDFKGRVDARVQAEILRDALGLVGRTVSLALWPVTKVFESKITGTLQNPKSEFLYFPKFLTWPFRPLRTLKEIVLPERSAPGQPAPKKSDPARPDGQPPGA